MFGKILNYEVSENKVLLNYEKIQSTITLINESVVNFFVPIHREKRNSKAVENVLNSKVKFEVKYEDKVLNIKTNVLSIIAKDTADFVISLDNYILDDGDIVFFTVNDKLENPDFKIQKRVSTFVDHKAIIN